MAKKAEVEKKVDKKKKKKKKPTLSQKLSFKKKYLWDRENKTRAKDRESICRRYMDFLTTAKTEREAHDGIVQLLEKNRFRFIPDIKRFQKGTGIIVSNRGKALIAVRLGKRPPEEGFNIIASHLDSPRLDLKQKPLYEDEDTNLALFRTHYYGGLKKYHWTNIPLALHGVVETSKGLININLGEKPDDPVFTIPDLLPHIANDQERRRLMVGIRGEELRVLMGSIPSKKAKKDTDDKVKLAVLDHLNRQYGMTEEDLVSAELTFVPAGPARDIGMDRSLIGSWGQDDKISSYLSIKALMDCKDNIRPAMVVLYDKEEIGSDGPTGAKSSFLNNTVMDIMEALDPDVPYWKVRKSLERSKALSTDVKSAINPIFGGVQENTNAARLGYGITITKYTGRGGKGGANDASAEFVGEIRRLFNKAKIAWQPQETGKVDEGGGGTVAKFLALHNMDVLDSGVPLLSMHSIFEVSSKQDVFEAYRGYLAFFNKLG